MALTFSRATLRRHRWLRSRLTYGEYCVVAIFILATIDPENRGVNLRYSGGKSGHDSGEG
jgi:hypothetical protein